MALDKIGVEIEVRSKGAAKSIASVTTGLSNFNKELSKNREGMKVLDQLTGGAVSQFQNYSASVKGGIKAVKGLSLSFKGLKAAIITTGIGAIVVALGLIVAYWDDITELVSGVSAEQKDLLATQEQSVQASRDQSDAISMTENTLRLQGKSEEDILAMKKAQTNETIAALEAQLVTQKEIKNSQVEAAKRNKNIAQGIIRFLTLPITYILSMIDAITAAASLIPGVGDVSTNLEENFSGGIANLLFDPSEVAAKGDATIEETEKQLAKLKNTRDGYELQERKNKEKKRSGGKKEEDQDAKEAAEKKRKEAELLAQIIAASNAKDAELKRQHLQSIENLENEYFTRQLSKQEQEEQAVRDKYFALIEAAKKYNEDFSILEKARDEELKDIKDKVDQEDIAREKALKKQQLASMGDTFGQVAGILGKKSAAGKAAAIAAATINTYQGISEVWGNESVLPEPLATIQKVVSSATTLAAGLKTVQQIKSTPKPKGVTGGSGGGGATPTFTPPAFNVVGATETSQLADAIGGQSQQPIQAYVVSDDVTTSQALDRNIVDGATIG
tara:strand:+ start:756 stop:2435 length:1680 start_codon:yes stop_codon:yes gene_type:complete